MLTLSAIPGLIASILRFFVCVCVGGGGMRNYPAGKELKHIHILYC